LFSERSGRETDTDRQSALWAAPGRFFEMPDDAAALIRANTRRNLGVFSVPRYLHDGDPYEKRDRISSRSAFATHRNTEWWRQNVKKERAAQAPKPASAPSPPIYWPQQLVPQPQMQSHQMSNSQPVHMPTPAGTVTWPAPQLSQGGVLYYVPCWLVPAPPSAWQQ
jgi:hypothetical protein